MKKKTKMKPATSLVHAGRNKTYANGAVNIPPYRSSTVLFDTLEEFKEVQHYDKLVFVFLNYFVKILS